MALMAEFLLAMLSLLALNDEVDEICQFLRGVNVSLNFQEFYFLEEILTFISQSADLGFEVGFLFCFVFEMMDYGISLQKWPDLWAGIGFIFLGFDFSGDILILI